MMKRILCVAALLAVAAQANAALMVEVTANPDPGNGLKSFTLTARGTAGEVVAGIAGLNVINIHNVAGPFDGNGTPSAVDWSPAGAGTALPEWAKYDTYFTINPTDGSKVTGFIGSFNETNNGSDPAGLNLMNFGQGASEGIGNLGFTLATDQIGLAAGAGGSTVSFLQAVVMPGNIPAGASQATWAAVLFDASGASQTVQGNFVLPPIPEPATIGMASMALLGLGAFRRRK